MLRYKYFCKIRAPYSNSAAKILKGKKPGYHFQISCISNLITQSSAKHAVTVTKSFETKLEGEREYAANIKLTTLMEKILGRQIAAL